MGSGFMRWMSQDSEHGGKIHCVFENLVSYRKRETGDLMLSNIITPSLCIWRTLAGESKRDP